MKRILAVAVCLLISGCIISSKKLLPDGNFMTAMTPVQPGYYLKTARSNRSGRMKFDATPFQLTLNGTTYALYEGGFKINTDPLVGEFFGHKDSNDIYIAQSELSNIKSWAYRRIDVGDGTFAMSDQQCSQLRKSDLRMLVGEGIISKVEGAFCSVNSPARLATVIKMASLWRDATVEYYVRIETSQGSRLSELDPPPKLDPMCDGAPLQALGAGFGDSSGYPRNSYLNVIAAANDGPLGLNAVAIEGSGNNVGDWAWLTYWPTDQQIKCKPNKLLRILGFRPHDNVLPDEHLNAGEINKTCRDWGYSKNSCGSTSDLISRMRKKGLKILLQGEEYFRFPNNRYTNAGTYITVMTDSEGVTGSYAIIYTMASGVGFYVLDENEYR